MTNQDTLHDTSEWHPLGPTGPTAESMADEHRAEGHPDDPLELSLIAKCPLCYAEGLADD